MIFRQLGAGLVAVFVFLAIVTAMSRLLVMKELPGYITNVTNGIANLFKGAFGS